MPEQTSTPASSATVDHASGDIGHRIARRREELGLTQEETASRAGTAPGYIRYLEEQCTAMPGMSVLIRLADVLETSVAALRGGEADLTPGIGKAAASIRPPSPGVGSPCPECRYRRPPLRRPAGTGRPRGVPFHRRQRMPPHALRVGPRDESPRRLP
ncbi:MULTISPECIES: helix-turn-helix domain-containing protein [unclassified Streptomyces]|uniref:helix-turn-helix domain-containing protein n=1 Tax=unclassified Streptomyces TaxID=2593676 RepID=UPI0011CDFFF5|nr:MULTISPECIES: helix-turn-helix transcriptional regulator [unclassified Streptomyces]TXS58074.1 XRE family transcriptional regulator [Streptomyces sp. me109]